MIGVGPAQADDDDVERGDAEDALAFEPERTERSEVIVGRPPMGAVVDVLVRRQARPAVIDPTVGQDPTTIPHAVAQVQQPELGEVAVQSRTGMRRR